MNLHLGSTATLHVSHHTFYEECSTLSRFPFHAHEDEENVTSGEIIRLDIGIAACASSSTLESASLSKSVDSG